MTAKLNLYGLQSILACPKASLILFFIYSLYDLFYRYFILLAYGGITAGQQAFENVGQNKIFQI